MWAELMCMGVQTRPVQKNKRKLFSATLHVWDFPIYEAGREVLQGPRWHQRHEMEGAWPPSIHLKGSKELSNLHAHTELLHGQEQFFSITLWYLKFGILGYSSEPTLIQISSVIGRQTKQIMEWNIYLNRFWWTRISVYILSFTIKMCGTKQG